MKNLLVMAVAAVLATNAFAADMKWNGSADWRYSAASENDQLSSVNNTTANQDVSTTKYRAHELRANLGVTGGWEHVEYGIGARTQAAANNEYVTVNSSSATNMGLNFEQAWFRYTRDFGGLDFAVTVGRQKNANVYDQQWETLFSNFDRWDGFGWNFKFGMFGLNASQYILGTENNTSTAGANNASTESYTAASQGTANTTRNFSVLYSVNPYMNWKFSDEIELLFSVAWYKWALNGTPAENQIGGGMTNITTNNSAGTVPALQNGSYLMSNASQWDFLANLSLPYNLAFTGDLVMANKAYYNSLSVVSAGTGASLYNGTTNGQVKVSNTAWTLGLTYGKLRKAQDFTIGYAYTTKGVGSVLDYYTNDKFAADNKGHNIVVGYNIADNLNLGFRWLIMREKQGIAASGVAATDGLAYTGANANQSLHTSYWELTSGMAF